ERLQRAPVQLPLDLRRVDRVARVVTRAILDEGNELGERAGAGCLLVEDAADLADDIDVPLLVTPADVVGLANPSGCEHAEERACMIVDVQPIAYLLPVSVDGQRVAVQRVEHHVRYQLLRKLI